MSKEIVMFARKLDPKMIMEPEITFSFKSSPKLRKDFNAAWNKRKRIKPIKRTRKRQIAKAKHMMAWHDQQVTSGHNGGTAKLESRRGGRNETN